MTFWSCFMYTIANIAGIFLFWLYQKERALADSNGPNKTTQTNNANKNTPKNNSNTNLNTNNNTTVKKRRRRFFSTAASLVNFLGVSSDDNRLNNTFSAFEDHYFNFEDVTQACRKAGLDTCGLIMGVDFSASNQWQGRKTFAGQNLHLVSPKGKIQNPYQKVISIIGRLMEPFDDDNIIPAFGFGDALTKGKSVFCLKDLTMFGKEPHEGLTDRLKHWGKKGGVRFSGLLGKDEEKKVDEEDKDMPCKGFAEVLQSYEEATHFVELGGPTDFAPVIDKAVQIVSKSKKYHILIVIADGQVVEYESTANAIVRASNHPLSIVMVGVGDGPWDTMETFDDRLPERRFDNFQFVDFHDVMSLNKKQPDANFALNAMMEIPDQYKTIKALGYLD